MLLSEGYVEGRKGAGTFVARMRIRRKHENAKPSGPAGEAMLAPVWRGWRPVGMCEAGDYRFDFVAGVPDTAFPFDIWQRLAARAARTIARHPVPECDPAGEPVLRSAIASHVSFVRAVACTEEDIVVTSGTRQAIDLLARILVTPGETEVAVEDPGYGPTRRSFVAAGAKVHSIPVDEEGLLVERLPQSIQIICVTPSHQFPLGVVLSARRRAELLEFAHRHGAVIIEDDYDSEFRHSDMPLDALQTLDRTGSVFYAGTFSKSMFTALRLGFVVVPEWARYALTLAKQINDWHCPLIPQLALADFIREGHLARHVRRMRSVYTARHSTLDDAIREHFGERLRSIRSHAGVHLAAEDRNAGSARDLVAAAERIRIEDIARYSESDRTQNGLVFGYGMIGVDHIEPAIEKLSKISRSLAV
jgi:GntR family transcriptional regulator/MocR family aminotransferase